MTLSNLTESERDVLSALTEFLRVCSPSRGMSKAIASAMDMSASGFCHVLARLVKTGHVQRVGRGLYEIPKEIHY